MLNKKNKKQWIAQIEGLILFDKPQGITSHDVVDLIREKFTIRRVGHAGTLDPLASGLLIILLGSYTSKQQKFQILDKVYEGKIVLGITTDTWDMDGKVLRKVDNINNISFSNVKSAISLFDGTVTQAVPPYSAVKYKGQTLYRLARKNRKVPSIKRTVRIKWLNWNYNNGIIDFKIRCSSGTYIRSIAYEIGEMLGCGGTLGVLRRISIGQWDVDDAVKIDDFKKMNLNDAYKLIIK
ncbi:MAG: tRNA pseudouridine(55) synthase TruB [Elusimicrobiales bacterium]|nr:tRNA pseudouridine(55) synthase TruB [Elusimicrobiales bacterium]